VIAIGDRFEFEVVAEGVENETQFELLQSRGVGLFQGHFFGRPRPLVLDQTAECAKPSAMVS
jgi:EAL domain-containing protein (putative c-di-GMP-specific phosphodiesterase class I)